MEREPPYPVIDGARVIAYAFVDDVPYRHRGALIVDGLLVEHVPRLAVCVNLSDDESVLLFHCDAEWNVLGAAITASVATAKLQAQENYPGVASRWTDLNTSVELALMYKA